MPSNLDKKLQDQIPELISKSHDWKALGQDYFDYTKIYSEPGLSTEIAFQMARPFLGKVDGVISTPTAAVIASQISNHLFLPLVVVGLWKTKAEPAYSIGFEPEDKPFVGYEVSKGEIEEGANLLAVTDIFTDGASFRILGDLAHMSKAKVIEYAAFIEIVEYNGRKDYPKLHALIQA